MTSSVSFGSEAGLSCLIAGDGCRSLLFNSLECVLLVSIAIVPSFEDDLVWVCEAVSAMGSVSMATVGMATGTGVVGFAEIFAGFLLVLAGFDVVASGKW